MNCRRTLEWSDLIQRSAGLVMGAAVLVCGAFCPSNLESETRESKRNPAGLRQAEALLAEGRQFFENRCAGCHGLDGRGGERAPNIATRSALQRSDARLCQIIKAGVPAAGMPGFAKLDDATTKALIGYLRFLQGKADVAKVPGSPRRGGAIFFGKARCSECHMLSSKGGFIASDLTAFGQGRSANEIREAIIKPTEGDQPNRVVLVVTHGGDKFMGVVRNEDNFSVQLQSLDGAFHFFMKREIESLTRETASLMPSDYGSSLSAQELDNLIGLLMSIARNEKSPVVKKQFREDEENE
jgi:cytochrome c oxidase cbb3-type subunit III